jgi:uncharacterized protein (DUF486 family)
LLYLLCLWIIAIFKECMLKDRNSHCLYNHKLYFNDSKLYQMWKRLPNVAIFTMFSIFYLKAKLTAKTIRVTWYLYKMLFSHRHHTLLIMGCKVSSFPWCNIFFYKSVCSKIGTLIVYIIISCILMTQNGIRCGKGCQM